MKRLLLTGATGFLGAAFRKWYELAGWSVVTLGRDKESDVVLTFDFEALAAQIANHGPFDRIVHSAAVNETQIATSLTDTYTINVTLSRLVAQIAIINKIPEVIYCSTFHVYGKYEGEIDKDFGCRPLND
jgi:UDP-glucose 4-epimerase